MFTGKLPKSGQDQLIFGFKEARQLELLPAATTNFNSGVNVSRKVEKLRSFFGMVGEEEIFDDDLRGNSNSQGSIFQRRNNVMVPLHENYFSRNILKPILEQQPFFVERAVKKISQKCNF